MTKLVLSAGARYDSYQIPEKVWTGAGSDLAARLHRVPRDGRSHAAHQLRPRLPCADAGGAGHQADVRGHAAGRLDLRAETLDTFELAVDFWPFERRVRLTATGFYNARRTSST